MRSLFVTVRSDCLGRARAQARKEAGVGFDLALVEQVLGAPPHNRTADDCVRLQVRPAPSRTRRIVPRAAGALTRRARRGRRSWPRRGASSGCSSRRTRSWRCSGTRGSRSSGSASRSSSVLATPATASSSSSPALSTSRHAPRPSPRARHAASGAPCCSQRAARRDAADAASVRARGGARSGGLGSSAPSGKARRSGRRLCCSTSRARRRSVGPHPRWDVRTRDVSS